MGFLFWEFFWSKASTLVLYCGAVVYLFIRCLGWRARGSVDANRREPSVASKEQRVGELVISCIHRACNIDC